MNIVFDLGAVLLHWRPADLVRAQFPERARDSEHAHALARAVFSHSDWHAFDQGLLSMGEVVQRTAHRLDLPVNRLHALVAQIGDLLTPIPETLALLTQLHAMRQAGDVINGQALRLYFLSNMPADYARVLEGREHWLGWFDGGIYSGDVQLVKPDPAIFEMLARRHGLAAGQTVFIDDLLTNVEAARALGWTGVHFQNAAQLATDLARLGLDNAAS